MENLKNRKDFNQNQNENDILYEEKLKTLAVMEIVLKQRIRAKEEKDMMAYEHTNIGVSENYQNLLECFSKFIRSAIYFVSENSKKNSF